MQTKHHHKKIRSRQDAGIALITSLLLMFLMSSLLVGFCILLISNQQLAGSNNADVSAFYGAEAGMEQLTANIGNLFAQTYSPTTSQINALETTPPAPVIPGISFMTGSGQSGYTVTLPSTTTYDSNGNPIPVASTVKIGPYAGLTAFVTEYTLTVNARTTAGREVKLTRTTQAVGIPAFSFGVFSQMDLSFFPGPNFNFGGRTHTNGNLFLAVGSGSTLTLSDKVDAYKDVIRTELSNGVSTATLYPGTVQVTTNPGTGSSCNACRTLAQSEGSWNPLTATADANWPTISTGSSPADYNHNLIDGLGSLDPTHSTGAKQLNLGIAILGNGTTQPVDLIRRPKSGESMTITAERYYDQASLRVLLSDNMSDIMNLPCIDASSNPLNLSNMATSAITTWSTGGNAADPQLTKLNTNLTTNGIAELPLASSGAAQAQGSTSTYTPADGYLVPAGFPIITGYIKIEEQTSYGNSSGCGTWKDVTAEILGYGYVGRNIDPVTQSLDGTHLNPQWVQNTTTMQAGAAPNLPFRLPVTPVYAPGNPAITALGPQNLSAGTTTPKYFPAGNFTAISQASNANTYICQDPHPYAIIRLERIRDNPSSVAVTNGTLGVHNSPAISTVAQACGVDPTTSKVLAGWTPQGYDFWPNVLFDSREGELRDVTMSANNYPTLNGTMSYIEVDGKNLANWFAGKINGITTTGGATKDPSNASNNFVLYISDRRGNYYDSTVQSLSGGWPPLSFSTHETGETGWTDIVNSSSSVAAGCPNATLDTGEDENTGTTFAGSFYYYGAGMKYVHDKSDTLANILTKPGTLGVFTGLSGTALLANDNCATVPAYSAASDGIWPMMVATNPFFARENPPLFFRRAVKITNANNLTALPTCPGGNECGLSIAVENPVYVSGDYNANSGNNGFTDPNVASSINADAVTLLGNEWNDVNTFLSPYDLNNRTAGTAYYRMAVLAGVTVDFPQPGSATSATVPQDFGTNGGVHNFLRYLENWNGTLNYLGSIVELYYSRQANGTFKCCNTVYAPPTRGYNFDSDFLNPLLLPPRTPLFRDVNTTGWTRLMLPSQ
jgi:hypothetical protein